MCPFVLLLLCHCVHWTPCLVLNPPFHYSKISFLETGYFTGNYLILQKNPVYQCNNENWLLPHSISFQLHYVPHWKSSPPDHKSVIHVGPHWVNQCGFCNDTCTIEWAKIKMHTPATGIQMAKDYDDLCKAPNPSKPCAPSAMSGCQSNLPPSCNHISRSTYHVDNSWRSLCHHSHSPSHSCSCSCSCDCYDNDHCKCCSLSNHHDSHYDGHHDFPPLAKLRVIDTGICSPVSYTSIASEVLSNSEGPDHTNENPYHPIHFDGHSNLKDPKTASSCPTTDTDYEYNKTSYIGDKSPTDLPSAFVKFNFKTPKPKNTDTG